MHFNGAARRRNRLAGRFAVPGAVVVPCGICSAPPSPATVGAIPGVGGSTGLCRNFLPPSPQPPSPPGKGEPFSFLLQGASPLATPSLRPCGIDLPDGWRVSKLAPEAVLRTGRLPVPETSRNARAASGTVAGLQGAKPLAKKSLVLPLPRRGKSALRARVGWMGAKEFCEVRASRQHRGKCPQNYPAAE